MSDYSVSDNPLYAKQLSIKLVQFNGGFVSCIVIPAYLPSYKEVWNGETLFIAL